MRYARLAEEAGFGFIFFSDHFHPWGHQQGHASFLWSVLGGVALSTSSIGLVSAVTCPILRWHPTALAQAASTVGAMSCGRFVLGLGTGERLNEGVTGYWPAFKERLERLEEMVYCLKSLWRGEEISHSGRYFTISKAQLFDAEAVPIALAASGHKAASLAGAVADAMIGLDISPGVIDAFKAAGGQKKPCWTQLSVCWAKSRREAVDTAYRLWPIVALEGARFAKLATPAEVSRACAGITKEDVSAAIVCGPDPDDYVRAIKECFVSGYQAVALHAIGPDQQGFLDFFRQELAPRLKL